MKELRVLIFFVHLEIIRWRTTREESTAGTLTQKGQYRQEVKRLIRGDAETHTKRQGC